LRPWQLKAQLDSFKAQFQESIEGLGTLRKVRCRPVLASP
jgi:hypothetical protein